MNKKCFWKVFTVTSLIGLAVAGKAFGADCAFHIENPGGAQVDAFPRWLSLGVMGLLSLTIWGLRRTVEKLENNRDRPVSSMNVLPGSRSQTSNPQWGTWAQTQLART